MAESTNSSAVRSTGGRSLRNAVLLFILISAIPLAIIVSLERSAAGFTYQTRDWFRECAKWDPDGLRFLASTFLGGGVVQIPAGDAASGALVERAAVSDPDVAGNASLGIAVDRSRGRLLVVYADLWGFRSSAVAAYDLGSWARLFLTRLSGPGDGASFADDVAVDEDGNAYITDAKGNKIWKVGLNGELVSTIISNVFIQRKEWYYNLVGLNGIVHHPDGYLLVIHTASGHLFKVNTASEEVAVVRVRGSLLMGDGMELVSPTKLVIAGTPSARLVESFDGWETANVTGRYIGPVHRIASSATVKDGRVYLNHIVGAGITKRTHVMAEAIF
ncbi:hypothetical protein OPV22_001072 [Ensete ventricosum]|uniref:SMP-30/Gluconolactonase/LRE-like region domain-containing protein n=1 Tax=Ensete ventricosum TaxID=4639 RepID=A0AAV8RU75_ENSVE|nr:hypothetical protein OPV22_001072 [Ensete ventricosum]